MRKERVYNMRVEIAPQMRRGEGGGGVGTSYELHTCELLTRMGGEAGQASYAADSR